MRTPVAHVFARFLVSGMVNTVASYALYLILLQVMPYLAAYIIAFVAGIIGAYWLNRVFVFRTRGRARTAVLFPLVYVLQLVLGALVTVIWVDVLHLAPELAAVAAIVLTVPLTFMLSRRLFTSGDGAAMPSG